MTSVITVPVAINRIFASNFTFVVFVCCNIVSFHLKNKDL